MLFKLKCGVAFELLVRVAREHVNLNAFTVLLVSICVWVRWFSQEENKRKITKIAWLEMDNARFFAHFRIPGLT